MVILQLWMDIKVRPFRGNNPHRCRGKGTLSLFLLISSFDFPFGWISWVGCNIECTYEILLFKNSHTKRDLKHMSLAFDEEIIGLFSEDSTCRQIIAILEVFGTTKFALELSLFARSVLHIARISKFDRVVSWERLWLVQKTDADIITNHMPDSSQLWQSFSRASNIFVLLMFRVLIDSV